MPFNAQDEFAKLVEDLRIGQVGRPIAIPRGTKFVPHRPDIVIHDLPVFFMEGNQGVDVAGINAAEDAIEARRFHLPYPRCAIMMSLSGDYGGLQHLHPRFHVRHSYVMVFEEDDEQLHVVSFMKAESMMEHWVRQLFDFYIPFGVQLDEVTVTYDPAWGTFPPDFIFGVEMSLWTRLQIVLSFIHKMMNRTDRGVASAIIGSSATDKINARRTKMNLPPIQQVVSIDLTRAITAPGAKGTGKGSPKKPHFRHGSWHTRKATGKRSWHPAVAVHGGAGVAPPWYEIKTPPLA